MSRPALWCLSVLSTAFSFQSFAAGPSEVVAIDPIVISTRFGSAKFDVNFKIPSDQLSKFNDCQIEIRDWAVERSTEIVESNLSAATINRNMFVPCLNSEIDTQFNISMVPGGPSLSPAGKDARISVGLPIVDLQLSQEVAGIAGGPYRLFTKNGTSEAFAFCSGSQPAPFEVALMESTSLVRVSFQDRSVSNRSGSRVLCIAGVSAVFDNGLENEINGRRVASFSVRDFISSSRNCIAEMPRPTLKCQNLLNLGRNTFNYR